MAKIPYQDSARYYDLIYFEKNYRKEAERLKVIISKHKKSGGKELLEAACGTGNYLRYLKNSFSCTGTDINGAMLAIAKNKVPGLPLKKADMITMNLHRQFDVVACLFSSIGYVRTYSNLERTIQNFSRHAKTGGLVIIEPWLDKEAYKPDMVHMTTYDGANIKIARLSASKIRGNISVVDMYSLVLEKNKGARYFVERHELGLFEKEKILEIMKKSGLKPRFLKRGLTGRGLYVGTKK